MQSDQSETERILSGQAHIDMLANTQNLKEQQKQIQQQLQEETLQVSKPAILTEISKRVILIS